MDRRNFLKGSAAWLAGLTTIGPLATQGMAATQKPAGLVPIGCVVAYLKSYTSVPVLPDEFAECNGQTLSDAQSVFNGQAIPNLNGASAATKKFLRGSSTSGTTGGAETSTTNQGTACGTAYPLHTTATCIGFNWDYDSDTGSVGVVALRGWEDDYNKAGVINLTQATVPPYYEVVYVMRIK